MKNLSYVRFIPGSLELGFTRLTVSLIGLAVPSTMMHHLLLVRIDRNGVGLQLFFVFSAQITRTGFEYLWHLDGFKKPVKMERLGKIKR